MQPEPGISSAYSNQGSLCVTRPDQREKYEVAHDMNGMLVRIESVRKASVPKTKPTRKYTVSLGQYKPRFACASMNKIEEIKTAILPLNWRSSFF